MTVYYGRLETGQSVDLPTRPTDQCAPHQPTISCGFGVTTMSGLMTVNDTVQCVGGRQYCDVSDTQDMFSKQFFM